MGCVAFCLCFRIASGLLNEACKANDHEVGGLRRRHEVDVGEPAHRAVERIGLAAAVLVRARGLQRGDEVRHRRQAVALAREPELAARLIEAREPDEVGQRLRELVQQVHRSLLLGLEPVDEVDLALEGRPLLLQLVHLLLDRLQLSLALLGGHDLAVQLADLARHVQVQGQADEDGAAREHGHEQVGLHGPRSGAAPADFFFLVGRSAARRLIRIIGRPPFGRPDRRRSRR